MADHFGDHIGRLEQRVATDRTEGRRGRPRRGQEPQLDHALLERLLVHGEFDASGETPVHKYPSFRELAERFGVSKTIVQRFARRHNCLERRVGSGAQEAGDAAPAEPAVVAPPVAASTFDRLLPSVREIFVAWVDAVKRGDTRITSAGEIEKMMRIAADLDAEAQQRAMLPTGYPTLEELQDLYEQREREYAASTRGERGETSIGLDEPSDTTREGA